MKLCEIRLHQCGIFVTSRRRHTRFDCDWSSDVCSSDLIEGSSQDRLRPDPLLSYYMPQRTHDNHFLPQAYLKPWSQDGNQVWAYRILVSNQAVPPWTRRSIRGTAFHQHLYTEISEGQERDDFERWIEAEY